jgi:signal transduction histidine kinase
LDVSDYFQTLEPLFRGLTHEIRNPVQGILASAEALRCRLDEDDSGVKLLDMIQRECLRINGLLTDLLTLSEPVRVSSTAAPLSKLLEECIRMYPNAIVNRIDPDLPQIHCDRISLRRAILAILQNAMESKSQNNSVSLLAERTGESVKIMISDQGEGISAEDLNHVLEPFFSTKPKKAGLGLTIAERILRLHNGDFRIESRLSEGTVVTLILPI